MELIKVNLLHKIRFRLLFVHHICRTGKPFGFFMSARDGLRPESLTHLNFVFYCVVCGGYLGSEA